MAFSVSHCICIDERHKHPDGGSSELLVEKLDQSQRLTVNSFYLFVQKTF